MRSPRLAALELRRFGRGKLPRAALVALLVLPLLYGALYLWSFWDPYGRLDRIPVALVNDDKGASRRREEDHGGRRHHQRSARQRDLRLAGGERRRGPQGRRGRHLLPVAHHARRLQRADRLQLRGLPGDRRPPGAHERREQLHRRTDLPDGLQRGAPGRVHEDVAVLPGQDLRLVLRHPRRDREGREGRRQAQGRHRQGREGLQGPRRRPEGRQGRQREAVHGPEEAQQGRGRPGGRLEAGRGGHPDTRRQGQRRPPARSAPS